jgi:pimeloyl-ACP methyl ester carboxylesterase
MRFRLFHGAAIAGAAALALFTATLPAGAKTPKPDNGPKPTIVLVHGAWADSSSWNPVIERLRRDGYPVRAIANPLQGLTSDTAYLRAYLATINGPKVLVGHSYGGAVITNAAPSVPDVKSLVYIAGFIPAKGETIGELAAKSTPALPLISTQVPDGTEVIIDPAQFRTAFAGDLDQTTATNLALTQRPANTRAVTDPSVEEGFRTIPSWALITRQDHAISPDLQRFMTTRAHAHTTEVDASHAVMLSRPDAVTKIIEQAAR